MAQGIHIREVHNHAKFMIEKKNHPSIFERKINLDIFNGDMNIAEDWRAEFREYLENLNKRVPHR